MSAAVAAAAAAASITRRTSSSSSSAATTRSSSASFYCPSLSMSVRAPPPLISRYECLKRRDWNNFRHYLRSRRPTLSVAACSGANVVEFLSDLDESGSTKVHAATCGNFGHRYPTDDLFCDCPTRQAWSSLAALIGRLRVAFEENGGNPVTNPFNTVDVQIYLNDLKNSQDRSRGVIDR